MTSDNTIVLSVLLFMTSDHTIVLSVLLFMTSDHIIVLSVLLFMASDYTIVLSVLLFMTSDHTIVLSVLLFMTSDHTIVLSVLLLMTSDHTIVLSVLLFMASDYTIGIFKLFLSLKELVVKTCYWYTDDERGGISSRFCGVHVAQFYIFCVEFCRSLFVHMLQDKEIKLAIVKFKNQDDRGLKYIIQTSDNQSVINKILTETGVSE
jgi:hypothetical protein